MKGSYVKPNRTELGDIRSLTQGGARDFDYDGQVFKDRQGGGGGVS